MQMPAHSRQFESRTIILGVLWILLVSGLSGCSSIDNQSVPGQTVKIGLIAPFEGRYREIGVDVIPAARLAIQEWAQRPEARQLAIELVAYDDQGDVETAIEQANRLLRDPSVEVVIGHWLEETTVAALPQYADQDVPLIAFTSLPEDFSGRGYSFNSVPTDTDRIKSDIEAASDLSDLHTLEIKSFQDVVSTTYPQLTEATIITGDSHIVTRQLARLLGVGFTDSVFIVSSEALPSETEDAYWDKDAVTSFQGGFVANSLGAPPGLFSRHAYEATWLAITWIAERHGISVDNTPVDHIDVDDQLASQHPYYVYRWENDQLVKVATIP